MLETTLLLAETCALSIKVLGSVLVEAISSENGFNLSISCGFEPETGRLRFLNSTFKSETGKWSERNYHYYHLIVFCSDNNFAEYFVTYLSCLQVWHTSICRPRCSLNWLSGMDYSARAESSSALTHLLMLGRCPFAIAETLSVAEVAIHKKFPFSRSPLSPSSQTAVPT